MTIYKILVGDDKKPCGVLKDNSSSIPFDPANVDYVAYLAWVAAGHEPAPADEPPAE